MAGNLHLYIPRLFENEVHDIFSFFPHKHSSHSLIADVNLNIDWYHHMQAYSVPLDSIGFPGLESVAWRMS